MRKQLFSALFLAGITVISGCVSSDGNTDLNSQAIQIRNSAKSNLAFNDKQLQACIVYSYLLQLENRIDPPSVETIKYACEPQEVKYRASVMANVRPSWQNRTDVLSNTANTATENVYSTVLRKLSQ
jgi:hypothetical protein